MSEKIARVAGLSSGVGHLTAEALARAGHAVYASMRDIAGRKAENIGFAVIDRGLAEMLHRVGLPDLPTPAKT